MSDLVSVIIPVFNAEKYLESCLDSIENQTYKNLEILVCDDGSTDSTWEILKAREGNPRIKLYQNQENKGVVYTRNRLLHKSIGNFIMIQDADDRSHPERIEKQLDFLLQNPQFGACGTQFIKCYKNRIISHSSLPSDYNFIKNNIPDQYHFLPGTLFFKAFLLNEIGYYNPFFANDGNEDLYLISKMILKYPFQNLNEHLYYYEVNVESITKLLVSNSRKHYIHYVTMDLLNSYKLNGSNILEENNEEELKLLEKMIQNKYGNLTPLDLLEKQIGQLLFFGLHTRALKILLFNRSKETSLWGRIKLFLYVLKRKLWK